MAVQPIILITSVLLRHNVLQALIHDIMRILWVNSHVKNKTGVYFLSDVVSGKIKKSSPILKKIRFIWYLLIIGF